jgi:hypothetical protein
MSIPRSTDPAVDIAVDLVDRRACVRYPCNLDSSCQPLAARRDMQWGGKVLNISRDGLALFLGRRFEVGTILAIELQGVSGYSSGTLLARVAHLHPTEYGQWFVGCAFINPLEEDDLRALLAETR